MDQNCHVEPIQKAVLDSVLKNADTTLLAVSGMGCVNCAARVRNGLVSLDGVHHAEIYLESGLVEVYFDGSKITQAMLVNAVAELAMTGGIIMRLWLWANHSTLNLHDIVVY